MWYERLAEELNWGVGKHAIRAALVKEGFHRRLAMRKPLISPKNQGYGSNRQLSTDIGLWIMAQWETILWTDETWITPGRHTCTWITRRAGEE
jgi:hypothetical protein